MDDYFKLCDGLTAEGAGVAAWGCGRRSSTRVLRSPSETVLLAIASHRSAGLCFWDAGIWEI